MSDTPRTDKSEDIWDTSRELERECDQLKAEVARWREMAREASDVCIEIAAYGSCNCDLESGDGPCVFCEANQAITRFAALGKGTE